MTPIKTKSIQLFLLTIFTFINISTPALYAQRMKSDTKAGEQIKAEKGLKDNRYFFYFINSPVSNFGSKQEKTVFREAILRDIIAQLLYMKFLFKQSYVEIRKSQKLLIDTYRKTLSRDIRNTKLMLNNIVPMIIEKNDKGALHYIKLGYRDLKVAEVYLGMGDHTTQKLYSMRLNKYVEAIKTAKHGMRYAILAMLAGMKHKIPKVDEQTLLAAFYAISHSFQNAIMEFDKQNLSFNRIERKITVLFSAKKRDQYLLIHYDSYFKTREPTSFYDRIWQNADINSIKDYQRYRRNLD